MQRQKTPSGYAEEWSGYADVWGLPDLLRLASQNQWEKKTVVNYSRHCPQAADLVEFVLAVPFVTGECYCPTPKGKTNENS